VLGDAAATLTASLGEFARTHDSVEERERRAGWAAEAKDRAGAAERRRLATGLRTTIKLIDEFMPFAPSYGTLADLVGRDTEATRLATLRRVVQTRLEVLEAHDRYTKRGRGRPQDIARSGLAHDSGTILRLSGIRVTTSRNSKFANVLAIVGTEVYGSAPEDSFRLIQKVAHFVNDVTIDELRELVRQTATYHTNPEFWLRLAQ